MVRWANLPVSSAKMPSAITNQGFLVVADITGYSAYLSHSELEHAQAVLKTLLDLMIDQTKAPLVLSGLEGDAVLSYTIDSDRFEGQAFVEMIEQTYVSFKSAINQMVMNTTCQCNACANINNLDLKFFVHHGEFVVQELAGRGELVGSDVNLIHRLMKNNISESTGIVAYTYLTSAAIERLKLDGFKGALIAHSEQVADIGEVGGWILDMMPIWQARKDQSNLDIDTSGAVRFVEDYPLPPELLWGYLTNPEYRSVFSNARKQVTHERRNGRVGLGTVYECFHLDNSVTTNTILEWVPFSRIVADATAGPSSHFFIIFEIERTADGSQVTMIYTPLRGPLIERAIGRLIFPFKWKPLAKEGMGKLRDLIEKDIAEERVSAPESSSLSVAEIEAAANQALSTS
jgi:uncharacterized protein YndB with AHSA1/START domain